MLLMAIFDEISVINLLLQVAFFWLVLMVFHILIRWRLRAPRVVEQSTPEAVGLEYSGNAFFNRQRQTTFCLVYSGCQGRVRRLRWRFCMAGEATRRRCFR